MNLSLGKFSKKMFILMMLATLLVAAILIISHRKEQKDRAALNIRQTNQHSGLLQHDNHEPAITNQQSLSLKALKVQIASWKQNQSALSEKIETLQSQIDDMAQTSQHTPDRTQVQDGEGSAVSETDVEKQEEENLSKIYEQIDLFENTIASESEDAQWSDEAVSAINKAMSNSQEELNMELLEVDCRSTLCRMSFSLDSGSPENGFKRLQDNFPWDSEMFFQVDDMDAGEAIVYIARKDHQLPRIAQP